MPRSPLSLQHPASGTDINRSPLAVGGNFTAAAHMRIRERELATRLDPRVIINLQSVRHCNFVALHSDVMDRADASLLSAKIGVEGRAPALLLSARSDSEREEDNHRASHRPNENKMSDGWRDGASQRVEGGISWKVRNQSCQPFAPSHG
jgi:hypothetical protein